MRQMRDPWQGGIYTYRRPEDVTQAEADEFLNHNIDPAIDAPEIGMVVIKAAAAVLVDRATHCKKTPRIRSELVSLNDPLKTVLAWRGPDGRHYTCLNLGDGPGFYSFPADMSPSELTALEAAQKALKFLDLWGQGDVHNAVLYAYSIGRLLERMHAQQHESDALKGKQQAEGAIRNGKSRQLLKDSQETEAAEEIAEMMRRGERLETACKSLVPKYGVSYKTLQRCYQRRTTG